VEGDGRQPGSVPLGHWGYDVVWQSIQEEEKKTGGGKEREKKEKGTGKGGEVWVETFGFYGKWRTTKGTRN